MRVAIFEVCRSPEVSKEDTEALVLSACFATLGIEFDLYSNDGIWADRPTAGTRINRRVIRKQLRDPRTDVAHFAVHGDPGGMTLRWGGPIGQRVPKDVLTGREIRDMTELRGKVVVSGACETAHLADDFLAAGAAAFVAPQVEIPWANLGAFFRAFYTSMVAGASAQAALTVAVSGHPELSSYRVYARRRSRRDSGGRRPPFTRK